MLKTIFAGLVLCLVSTSLAFGTTIKVPLRGQGIIRVQRIESSLIIGDVFGGMFGDEISLAPGTYRLQAVSTDGGALKIAYFEFDLSYDGVAATSATNPPISSAPYRNQVALVEHLTPAFVIEGGHVVIVLSAPSESASRSLVLPPLIRATNWVADISKMRSVAVHIESQPPNAEIWIDGEKSNFLTNAAFVIPIDQSRPLASMSILVRKAGYANQILQIDRSEPRSDFKVILEIQ